MKFIKRLIALGLAAGLTVAGGMTAFAEDYNIVFSGVFTPAEAIEDTGSELTASYYGMDFSGKLYNLLDENTTLAMDEAQSSGMAGNPVVYWGYLDGSDFVSLGSWESSMMGNLPMNDSIQGGKNYPVINPEQLAKDKADGSAYSKTYVVMINAVNTTNYADDYMGYFFKLKQGGTNASAAAWKKDSAGWWYDNGDGTYPANQWKEISGKFYYFGADGYMLHDTVTPDNYQVGSDGAWIQ